MLEKITGKSDSYISKMPFHAYEGNEPYIFISYSHKDANLVFPELKRLHDAGLNIWYDQGIAPGNEWTEEIGNALDGCSLFIVFISKNSANSVNVRNEINYALHENKRFFSIYLEETELPSGLKLSMGSLQAILKYVMDEEEYIFRCNKALRQNGFDIKGDGKVKYDVKTTPKRSAITTTKKPKINKSYIAIGVIAIILIMGVVLYALPLQTSNQNSNTASLQTSNQNSNTTPLQTDNQNTDMTLEITSANVDSDGLCFIWGTLNPMPSNFQKLKVKVDYYDSSGKLVETLYNSIDVYSGTNGEYLLSNNTVQNKNIDKVHVSIVGMNDNVLCSDDFKLN